MLNLPSEILNNQLFPSGSKNRKPKSPIVIDFSQNCKSVCEAARETKGKNLSQLDMTFQKMDLFIWRQTPTAKSFLTNFMTILPQTNDITPTIVKIKNNLTELNTEKRKKC